MLMMNWLESMRLSVRASSLRRKTRRRKSARGRGFRANTAAEVLEERILLSATIADDSEYSEEESDDSSLDEAQQAVDDAQQAYDVTMAEAKADAAEIGATLQSEFSTAQAEFEDSLDGIKQNLADALGSIDSTYDTQVESIQQTLKTTIDGLDDTRDTVLQVVESDFSSSIITAESTFKTAVTTGESERDSSIESAEQNFNTAVASHTATLDADLATARNDFDTDTIAADALYESAVQQATATFKADEAAFHATYETTVGDESGGLVADFNADVAAAEAARDAVLAVYPHIVFDAGVPDEDPIQQASITLDDAPIVKAAIASANETFLLRLTAVNDAYSANIDSLWDGYGFAVETAVMTRDTAGKAAGVAYDSAALAAEATHENTLQTAQDDHDSAVETLEFTYDTSLMNARGAYDTALKSAQGTYDTAVAAAQGVYDAAVKIARDTYTSAVAGIESQYGSDVDVLDNQLSIDLKNSQDEFDDDMRQPNTIHADAVKDADDVYSNAVSGVGGFQEIRDGKDATAYDTFNGKEQTAAKVLQDAKQAAAEAFWLGIGNDDWINTKTKQYFVNVAYAKVTLASDLGTAAVGFVTSERPADTTRQKAIIKADYELAIDAVGFTEARTIRNIGHNTSYEQDVAQLDADKAIEIEVERILLVGATADAKLVFDKAVHAAEEQKTIDIAAARLGLLYATATAQETWANGEVGAWETNANSVATAEQVLANSLSAASAAQWIAGATADNTFARTVAAEQTQLMADIGVEEQAFVTRLTAEVLNWTTTVSTARTTAFVAQNGNDVSYMAVANAWEQYDLDLATAWSDAVNAEQTAGNAYSNSAWSSAQVLSETIADAALSRETQLSVDFQDMVGEMAGAEKTASDAIAGELVTAESAVNAVDLVFAEGVADAVQDFTITTAADIHMAADLTAEIEHEHFIDSLPAKLTASIDATYAELARTQQSIGETAQANVVAAWAETARTIDELSAARPAAERAAELDDAPVIAAVKLKHKQFILAAKQRVDNIQNTPKEQFAGMDAAAASNEGYESTFWSGVLGTFKGLGQGFLNILNGLQDTGIGILNLPAMFVNGIAWIEVKLGIMSEHAASQVHIPYIKSHDWSRGMLTHEAGTGWADSHNWSKGLGAGGVELAFGLWWSRFSKGKQAASLLDDGVEVVARSAGDLFEDAVKETFRKKIIRENEILRDKAGKVIAEIDFETAEAIVEVGISLKGKVGQLHKLAGIAAQRGKRLDVIYGPNTSQGTLNFLMESLRKKWGNRVRFIPHG